MTADIFNAYIYIYIENHSFSQIVTACHSLVLAC